MLNFLFLFSIHFPAFAELFSELFSIERLAQLKSVQFTTNIPWVGNIGIPGLRFPLSAPLSRFPLRFFPWRPACHRKKENVMHFHRCCHIENGIEQCNNNEMCVTHEMK